MKVLNIRTKVHLKNDSSKIYKSKMQKPLKVQSEVEETKI